MLHVPDNIRHDIIRLVPRSVVNDICCFVYYDNHPRDNKCVDIIICTKSGEVKEFHQRELVTEITLEGIEPLDIKIIRNSLCELFYLVKGEDQIIILSRRDKLYVHRKEMNVEVFDIDDSTCQGQACLKITKKDDTVPLIFDDKFESLGERALLLSNIHAEETVPILTDLQRKLIEAKYSFKCNENTYKELQNLRQLAAFSMYQKLHPNLEESVFKSGSKAMAGAFKIKSHAPWVKLCNKKIVVVLNIVNNNEESMEDVHLLLHSKITSSVVYTTKLFLRTTTSPFWKEKEIQSIEKSQEVAVVAVIDLKEIKENILSKLDFNGVLVYKKAGKEYLLPFDGVSMSTLDTMGEDFDVLSTGQLDDPHIILALLASTEKTVLILRHIRKAGEPVLNLLDIFCNYLQMEQIPTADNVLINRKSPYHPLNGVMLVLSKTNLLKKRRNAFSIHTRSPSQVQAFVHYVHDAIPYKIVITTSNYIILAKTYDLCHYNEIPKTLPEPGTWNLELGHLQYATAMVNQTGMLINHLDTCMMKMNDSKIPEIQRKLGTEIDLFAAGLSVYTELRNSMLDEELRGLRQLRTSTSSERSQEGMIVDNI